MAYKWTTIAKGFPPSLNKDDGPETLKPFESPAVYGVSADTPDKLYQGSCPIGTARATKTYTISGTTYTYLYNRLWLASGSKVLWGAPEYRETFYPQKNGVIDLPDAGTIITFLPVGIDGLAVLTASGGVLIPNANNPEARFVRTDIVQEVTCAAATYATELDGVVYVSNANGLFAWDGQRTAEITEKVRNSISSYASKALTCNYAKKHVIGTSTFVWDAPNKKFFDYATSGFLYTTPTVQSEGYRPYSVAKLAFVVDYATAAAGTLTFSVKFDDGEWGADTVVNATGDIGAYTTLVSDLDQIRVCRRLSVRITAMSSNLAVREIQAYAEGYTQETASL